MPEKHIVLATLGSQPQVVTFTLDLLLPLYPINDVIVLHPAAVQEKLQRSLQLLQKEFSGDYYTAAKRTIHFRQHVLQLDDHPLAEIDSNRAADGVLDTLHTLIGDLKRQGYCIHLSITGGRRLMGLLATSVAALNFDRHDHVWHIYTPDHIKEQATGGALMHVPYEAGIQLIQTPFLPLGAYIYQPRPTFHHAQDEQRLQQDAQRRSYCKQVFELSTPAQQNVLREYSKDLRPQQIAEQLKVHVRTVHKHTSVLLDHCYNVWAIDPPRKIDYHFIQKNFTDYFSQTQP